MTSGSVTRKIPCETMVAQICPYPPKVIQKIMNPSAEMTGGSAKGASPIPVSSRAAKPCRPQAYSASGSAISTASPAASSAITSE